MVAPIAQRDVPAPKVLLVGGEDHALRIPFLLQLKARGISVAAAGTGTPGPFRDSGIEYLQYHFERFASPLADLKAISGLQRVIAATAPRVVQSFDTKPNLLVPFAAMAARAPAVIVRTINGMGWTFSSRSRIAAGLRPLYRTLQRIAARGTAATVFQNRDDQRYFERRDLIGRGFSRLIPGSGIDVEAFARAGTAGSSAAELRAEFGLGDGPVVMTVSRINRQKGIPVLLAAAARIHRERPNVRFLLVGPLELEGPMAMLRTEIEAHRPYVVATGPRKDVPALLAIADVFAFPTEYREGVPRVLLEAALARVPIVTSDLPGCSDVVDGRASGLLVPPGAADDLARGVLRLLDDRPAARRMAECAAEHVASEFNLQKIVDSYSRLYAELAERSAKHTNSERIAAGS